MINYFQQIMIQTLVVKMPLSELCELGDINKQEAESYLNEYKEENKIITFEQKEKTKNDMKRAEKANKHKQKPVIIRSLQEKRKVQMFETKKLDPSQLKTVKVDSKTSIQIPINANAEEEIRKYKARIR